MLIVSIAAGHPVLESVYDCIIINCTITLSSDACITCDFYKSALWAKEISL